MKQKSKVNARHLQRTPHWRIIAIGTFIWVSSANSSSAATATMADLLATVRISTSPETRSEAGMILSQRAPNTESDLKHLLAALDDSKTAAFSQIAISNTMNRSLGAPLHAELRHRLSRLKHVSNDEFRALPAPEQGDLLRDVMGIAAIVQALGNIAYKPAIEDVRALLAYDHEFQGYLSLPASASLGAMGDKTSAAIIMKRAGEGGEVTLSGFDLWGAKKVINELNRYWDEAKTRPLQPGDPRNSKVISLGEQLPGFARRGNPQLKAALRRLIYFPQNHVRIDASHALMFSIDPDDKAISREMLRNDTPGVRMNGVISLRVARTWDASFLPLLLNLLAQDGDEGVRMMVLKELRALIGQGVRRKELEPAVPFVEKALYDKDLAINMHAFDTYHALTGKFQRYPRITPDDEKEIQIHPPFEPEDMTKTFNVNTVTH